MKGDTIELNGKDFVIVEELLYNNKNYLYVIDASESDDIALLEKYKENDIEMVKSVDDEKEFSLIMSIIAKNLIKDN